MKMLNHPLLICLCMAFHCTVQLDSSSFLIYNEAHNKCAQVAESNAIQAGDCIPSSASQQFRWISASRILSVSHKLCLGAQDLKEWVRVVLLPCSERSAMQTWECRDSSLLSLKGQPLNFNYGNRHEPNIVMFTGNGTWSRWQIYGTKDNLCSHGYQEMFSIGGNAFGSPCQFPFQFEKKWYAECTKEGRSDGQLWCATVTDYDNEKKWGFCPTKSLSGWDTDPVTGVLYQRNVQSVLTWHQARKSCQQQDADLLSIVELHEQTYISGLTNSLGSSLWMGLNSLDFESGWQWSNGNPFRYLNWAPGQPLMEPGINCVALNAGKASKWESMSCSSKLGYICRKGNSTSTMPVIDKDQTGFCPPTWVPYAGHCYSIHRTPMLWRDALAACRKDGADLTSIHSIEEHSFIISQSGYLPTDELWIGLNDQKIQNLFEWSDRTHVTFAKWLVGEPSHATNLREDCVLMKGQGGQWADYMCEREFGYMCKKKASIKPAGSTEVKSPGCPNGWTRHSSFCYNIAVEAKRFDDAKAACEQNAADLVNVANRYENAFLISQIGLRPEKYFWLGLSNTKHADTFQWTNSKTTKYTHFNAGMPDKHQGCVAMRTGTSAGLWDVIPCDSKQKFICKKIAEGVTTTKEPPVTPPLSCPPKWSKKGSSSCIRLFRKDMEQKKTWFEALEFCKAIGGDLASFHSENELTSITYSMGSDPAWIGFQSLDENLGFVWSDGSTTDYQNWGYGEPNNYNSNEHCGETSFYYGRMWNDRDCESYNDWICQIKLGTTPKPPPTNVPQAEYNVTGDGWLVFNESQYFINYERLSMDDARTFCKKNHSDLIVMTGQNERKFIWKQISRGSESQYYIGIIVELDKSFSTVDGSPVVFTAWEQNEPNFANNDENCVGMYKSSGFWNDINCGVPLPSICKRSNNFATSTAAPTTPPKGGCAPDWTLFSGKCYKFVEKENKQSWHDARQYCISQGGNLVSVLSSSEQAFLTTTMMRASDDMWIGLNDVNWEMRFLWTDGRGVRYTNWAKGHPVSVPDGRRMFGSEIGNLWELSQFTDITDFTEHLEHPAPLFDCVVMVKEPARTTGMWKVEDCNEKRGFICKRKTDLQIQVLATTVSSNKYSALGNDSYKINLEKMSWDEARRQCKADDAELASILDSVTQALTILRINKLKEPMWIGLNSNVTGGQYQWVDNWKLQYTHWAPEEPSRNQACVYVDLDGTWKTADCSKNLYSLCKQSSVFPPTGPPQLPGICPESKKYKTWIPFRGDCYTFVVSRSENWAHATVECMRMGATLVSVQDALESQFIQQTLELLHDEAKSFWIGMHRSHKGMWMWIDNNLVSYTNWDQRSPSSTGDCVEVRSESGLWMNSHCMGFRPFICKTPKVIPPTVKAEAKALTDKAPHSYTGIAVAVVLVIIAVVGLVAFLLYKKPTIPVIGECTFDNMLYFNNPTPSRSTTTVDTKGLVANIEQNECA